ncbi:fatty-acid amide hydrolase 2-like [Oppia nitens]|uniref:fatty-acid amide hydrolase 2-like n=1 Tax=Oppia nitens TaxID=1686743 RepID=UPI0023DC900F|nr:fatty-acid amide hydrolase 2-like [Oppia nitens]
MKSLFVFTPSISSDFGQNYVHLGRELKLELKQLLAKDGILIYPTYPEPPPKHMSTIVKLPNISYTTAISTLGVPVTNCPLGLTKSGYPIGLQIVGSPFNDRLTIAVANELEKAFGGWVSPTNIVC